MLNIKLLHTDNALTSFFVSRRYRAVRHLALIATAVIVSFNQVFLIYRGDKKVLGNILYVVAIMHTGMYLIVLYANYLVLVPKILLQNKHLRYVLFSFLMVLLIPFLSIVTELGIRDQYNLQHRITNYVSPLVLLDVISSSVITLICLYCCSIIVFFRRWKLGYLQIESLQERQSKLLLETIRNRLDNNFLRRTLNEVKNTLFIEPKNAIKILFLLSETLRYQLYDSNREAVTVASELKYLLNYLALEKINRSGFNFELSMEGERKMFFVLPMTFVPLIRPCILDHTTIVIVVRMDEQQLSFSFSSDSGVLPGREELDLMNSRLQFLSQATGVIFLNKDGGIDLEIRRK